jgi:hypothetical protein
MQHTDEHHLSPTIMALNAKNLHIICWGLSSGKEDALVATKDSNDVDITQIELDLSCWSLMHDGKK